MSANEMISCEFRDDGFHVTAFRHNGKIVANSFHIEVCGHDNCKWNFAIEGTQEFSNEQDLYDFARGTILPCAIKKMSEQYVSRLASAAIMASVCDMSIGREAPNSAS